MLRGTRIFKVYLVLGTHMQVLLSLVNNWSDTGGIDEFVKWSGGGDHTKFYTDPSCRQMYKAHVAAVINRVNSINGRRYRTQRTLSQVWLPLQIQFAVCNINLLWCTSWLECNHLGYVGMHTAVRILI